MIGIAELREAYIIYYIHQEYSSDYIYKTLKENELGYRKERFFEDYTRLKRDVLDTKVINYIVSKYAICPKCKKVLRRENLL